VQPVEVSGMIEELKRVQLFAVLSDDELRLVVRDRAAK
jgi:hypothetical protein